MPFIPHTKADEQKMLETIGVPDIEALFAEIPQELRADGLNNVPEGVNEMTISRIMKSLAAKDGEPLCFIGAGAYEHHIPAAVWEIVTRGEFYSAYTPYQAEASQGTLQLIYEFQTMIASLMGLDVSNASLYDGASALSEAVLMAIRANRKSKSKRILIPTTVNPDYIKVVDAIVKNQEITLELLEYGDESSVPAFLDRAKGDVYLGRVMPVIVEKEYAFHFTLLLHSSPHSLEAPEALLNLFEGDTRFKSYRSGSEGIVYHVQTGHVDAYRSEELSLKEQLKGYNKMRTL